MKTISSSATFFVKRVFPIVWITVWGAITVTTFLIAPLDPSTNNLQWGALTAALITSSAIIWLSLTAKVVQMNGSHLYVSNYRREIQIPFSDVERVTETFFFGPKLITVILKSPTEFGTRIRFLPEDILFDAFRSHPIVKELRSHLPSS